jgi:hypothetical protein
MEHSNKDIYSKWSQTHPDLPLFFHPWWLDAVCGKEAWEVALVVNHNQEVEGALPFYKSRRWGLSWSGMPMLTPYLGPLLVYPARIRPAQKVTFEKRVMNELIDQLPRFFYFRQNWHPDFQNWLPFYWRGFRQTTYYTYRFPDISRPDRLFQSFRSSTRNHIRVAERAYRLEESDDLATFYALNKMTFEGQSMKIPYDLAYLKKMDDLLHDRKWSKLLLAYSEDTNRYEAGIYVVRDHQTAYLLASGRHPESSSGAVPLLIWQALKQLSREGVQQFDFEGSVIPGIEQFFRSFGAELTPYFQVSKARYGWVELLRCFY